MCGVAVDSRVSSAGGRPARRLRVEPVRPRRRGGSSRRHSRILPLVDRGRSGCSWRWVTVHDPELCRCPLGIRSSTSSLPRFVDRNGGRRFVCCKMCNAGVPRFMVSRQGWDARCGGSPSPWYVVGGEGVGKVSRCCEHDRFVLNVRSPGEEMVSQVPRTWLRLDVMLPGVVDQQNRVRNERRRRHRRVKDLKVG